MYTTIIHPIRVALNLSLNEYCVLDSIYRLSQNVKYGGWCVQSKANIAKDLGLGDRVVFTIIKTLEEKDLIERNDQGNLRTKDSWNEMMANKHDYYLALDGKESQFVSGRPIQQVPISDYAENADTMQNVHTPYAQNAELPMHNVHTTIRRYNKKDNNTLITNVIKGAEPKFGNEDINKVLTAIRLKVGISDFADSQRWQRIYGKHLFSILSKIGAEEFGRRLDIILKDSFKRKRCNETRYIYEQLKGFIEPNISSKIILV